MLRDIIKRLTKLEGRGFTTLEIQSAAKNYHATGELPTDPRLSEIILDIDGYLAALRASMPGPPEPTPEQLHDLEHSHTEGN